MPRRPRHLLYALVVALLALSVGLELDDRSSESEAAPRDGLEEFLQPWYDAVRDHEESPATVVVVGDSISEGVLLPAPVHELRYVGLLQEALRERAGATGGEGYVPAFYADPLTPEDTVRSGTPAEELSFRPWGLGGRALLMPGGAEVIYPALPATRVRVWYGRTAVAGGQAKVFVDGVDLTALGRLGTGEASGPTISSGGGAAEAGLQWVSPPLAEGDHVVQVRSVAPGFAFLHTGVEFLDGDEESGIHVVDASHSGATARSFATPEAVAGHWREVAAVDPDLVLVNLGTNMEPDYRTSLSTVVDEALDAAPDAQVVLVHGFEPGTATAEEWQEVREDREAVAERHPGRVAVFDLAAQWPSLAKDGSTNESLMVEVERPVHPNAEGHARMAEILTDLLAPPEE